MASSEPVRVLLVLLALLASVSVGCTDTETIINQVPDLDEGCLDAGTCECRTTAQCADPANTLCVDGMCVPRVVYADAGPDGSTAPDSGIIGDGCGISADADWYPD